MKFKNPLLVVTDMERSVAFYREVLGLRKVVDLGANVTLRFAKHCARKAEREGETQ